MRVMLWLMLVCTLVAATARADEPPITIVREGKSDYVIAIPEMASAAETLAAGELKAYVKQMSGAELPVVRGETPRAHTIRIQRSATVRNGGHVRPENDAFAIEVKLDGRAVLSGAGDRAVLYATYALLQQLGCR